MRNYHIGDDDDAPAWPFLPVLLALVAAWLLLGWPWLSGRVTVPWDAKAHFQPQIQFLAASLARGESPFWAPYVFSGHPQIADPQSLIFQPPFLILALLNAAPSLRAVDTTVLAAILVGAAALMLVLRDLRWHWAGALLAGIVFGFGAAMAWRIQHVGQVLSLAYLPVVLLLLSRALARRSVGYGMAAGLAAAFMVLGRDQVALLGVYLLIGYVAWWIASAPSPLSAARSAIAPLCAGALVGVLVIALPILMTAEIAAQSNRPEIDLEGAGRGSLHPALALTLLAPDVFGSSGRMEDYWGPPSFTWNDTGLYIAQNVGQLYVGAAPLLLLLLGLVSLIYLEREVRFYAAAFLLVGLYALGWYTPFFAATHALLPGVNLYRRPADAVFVMGFLMAILAGYTLHRLMTTSLPRLSRAQIAAIALVVVAGFAYALYLALHFDRLARAVPPLSVAAASILAGTLALMALAWLYPLRPVVAVSVLMATTVADLAFNNGPGSATALPPATYEVLEPTSTNETIALLKARTQARSSDTVRDRVELLGLGFHWPNASLTHGLEHTLGYNPVRLGLYTRATGAEDHIGMADQRKFTPLFPSFRSHLADLLGLRFIASPVPIEQVDKALKPGDLVLVGKTQDGLVYENPRTLPRVLFADSAVTADFEALLKGGRWPSVDLARTVLLEDAGAATREDRPPGQARIVSYRNTEVVVSADSPAGGHVVLNDIWHPWWHAEVDGVAAPLLRANVLFRAVKVPPGRHEVRFVFRPIRSTLTGLLARLAGRTTELPR